MRILLKSLHIMYVYSLLNTFSFIISYVYKKKVYYFYRYITHLTLQFFASFDMLSH